MSEMRQSKVAIIFSVLSILTTSGFTQQSKEKQLLTILGDFPTPPALQIETLESIKLDGGWRHKIEYVAEKADPLFDRPIDKIRAYLFIPEHKEGRKLPAIVALHQAGGPQVRHLGKLEPAGLGDDQNQHYGLDLFKRGYVVICPDRLGHGERRKIKDPIKSMADIIRDFRLTDRRYGQFILYGRTATGKNVYDLMRAADVLCSLDYVDKERIGTIGHSGGGINVVFFMFVDKRIKVGVSSCGFSEVLATFNEYTPQRAISGQALYGLAKIGRSTDYLAFLAPRPFLMTRGLWEYGGQNNPQSKWYVASKKHVAKTKEIENYARKRYRQLNANENLKAIYFDEAGGNHAFPPGVKEQAYKWLDGYLKGDKALPGSQKDAIDVRYNNRQDIEHTKVSLHDKENELLKILGDFPTPPPLNVDILESVKLDRGVRHKIEYSVEEANPLFNTPADKIHAYLFVPDHSEGQKLPAIIAIHRSGVTPTTPMGMFNMGKREPAGFGGDDSLHYGLELFERGYVVICPDQFSHGERRRVKDTFTKGSENERDFFLAELWLGQLLLSGRTGMGKIVYDLMRAVDVLCSLDYVDKNQIGTIGHSEGGNYLVYFMFADRRIKVGVSSCGFYELLAVYHENAPLIPLGKPSGLSIPGLAKIGRSADYLAFLAPRPFLMSRGLWEYGKASEAERSKSSQHVAETKDIEDYAKQRYSQLNAIGNLKAIYFDEGGGNHAFPSKVRQQAYQWLDIYLK